MNGIPISHSSRKHGKNRTNAIISNRCWDRHETAAPNSSPGQQDRLAGAIFLPPTLQSLPFAPVASQALPRFCVVMDDRFPLTVAAPDRLMEELAEVAAAAATTTLPAGEARSSPTR